MTINAIYENGVFRPIGAVNLPDKRMVRLSIEDEAPPPGKPELLGEEPPLMALLRIVEQYPANPDSPTDGAAQHDHYLYGTPKRP